MIPINSLTLRYGIGCFETLKVSADGHVFFLDEHLERLAFGAQICKLSIPAFDELKQQVLDFCAKNYKPMLRVLRIVLTMEDGVTCFIEDYFENTNPLKLQIAIDWRIDSESPLNAFKSFNYLKNHLAWMQAHNDGFDDAVLLNEKKHIVESSRSNLFFQDANGAWCTPVLESGCLPGIVRGHLIKHLKAHETIIFEADLASFVSCLATNSLIEARNVGLIDNYRFEELDLSEIKSCLKALSKT
ncbi:MAG: aminotransferase class IV [Candidatus Caenarcaniphilales bacterium]|nr:aminotransferase class IV [Candidatus Caenarcaniphilales bacterium]